MKKEDTQDVKAAIPSGKSKFPLPRYEAPARPKRIVKKRSSGRKILFRAVVVLAIVLLSSGGFLAWKGYVKLHKVFRGTSTVAALSSKPVMPDLLKGEGDGRVNILLLGIGGPGHDGPDLTDTMVVLSVDPVNNTATMLSIPRDLWVKMPVNYFGSVQKINAAYESGKYHYAGKLDPTNQNGAAIQAGFAAVDETINMVLGVHIDYHMLVDFQAFRQAVDTVGGVTINVPTELYDPTMEWENHNNPVLVTAGVQQMDGVKALLYARSRETTSDFARAERQRQILVALKDKMLNLDTLSNPTKIAGLMDAFGDNLYSDLSTQGASRFMGIMRKIDDTKIASVGLTNPPHVLVTTDHVGTASVVRPVAGFNNYDDIQTFVRSQLPDGYIVKENAPVDVVGYTTAAATQTTALLKTYGYNVISSTTTVAATMTPTLVDLSKDGDPYTKHYLEDRYGLQAITSLPTGVSASAVAGAKFVIIGVK